jgi:hypothetical protein
MCSGTAGNRCRISLMGTTTIYNPANYGDDYESDRIPYNEWLSRHFPKEEILVNCIHDEPPQDLARFDQPKCEAKPTVNHRKKELFRRKNNSELLIKLEASRQRCRRQITFQAWLENCRAVRRQKLLSSSRKKLQVPKNPIWKKNIPHF